LVVCVWLAWLWAFAWCSLWAEKAHSTLHPWVFSQGLHFCGVYGVFNFVRQVYLLGVLRLISVTLRFWYCFVVVWKIFEGRVRVEWKRVWAGFWFWSAIWIGLGLRRGKIRQHDVMFSHLLHSSTCLL